MPFKKGQSGNPNGRPEGAKNKVTLDKEARRAMFEERISAKWLEIIDQLKPEYVADQFIGKSAEKIDLDVKLKIDV